MVILAAGAKAFIVRASSSKKNAKTVPCRKAKSAQNRIQLTAQNNAGSGRSVSDHMLQQSLFDIGLCIRYTKSVSL